MRSPMASPLHHRNHSEPYDEPETWPAIQSVVTPFVALIVVLAAAPRRISASTSRRRSSAGRRPTRRSRAAPTTASSVLPTEIAAATGSEAPLVAFATSAPSATAGHSRGPKRTSAASEMPVGAHTGVMTPWATERSIPSLAAPM